MPCAFDIRGCAPLALAAGLTPLAFGQLDRGPMGLAPPFGSWPILLVHLVAAIPSALLASIALAKSRRRRRALCFAGSMLLLASCGGHRTAIPGIQALSDRGGLPVASLLRSSLALLSVLPVSLIAVGASGLARTNVSFPLALTSFGFLIVPPSVYAILHADHLANDAVESMQRRNVRQALAKLSRLRAQGDRRTIGGRSLPTLMTDLSAEMREMQDFLDRTPEGDSPAVRTRRAEYLARMDRFPEAEAILRPLEAASIDARLLLAAVYQATRRFDESDSSYRGVRDDALAWLKSPGRWADRRGHPAGVAGLTGRRAHEACRRAFDGLAFNAVSRSRWDEAERTYRRAMLDLAGSAPYFLYRLGLLFKEKGDAGKAVEALQASAPLLPPQYRSTALLHLDQIRRETPSCSLGRQSR